MTRSDAHPRRHLPERLAKRVPLCSVRHGAPRRVARLPGRETSWITVHSVCRITIAPATRLLAHGTGTSGASGVETDDSHCVEGDRARSSDPVGDPLAAQLAGVPLTYHDSVFTAAQRTESGARRGVTTSSKRVNSSRDRRASASRSPRHSSHHCPSGSIQPRRRCSMSAAAPVCTCDKPSRPSWRDGASASSTRPTRATFACATERPRLGAFTDRVTDRLLATSATITVPTLSRPFDLVTALPQPLLLPAERGRENALRTSPSTHSAEGTLAIVCFFPWARPPGSGFRRDPAKHKGQHTAPSFSTTTLATLTAIRLCRRSSTMRIVPLEPFFGILARAA